MQRQQPDPAGKVPRTTRMLVTRQPQRAIAILAVGMIGWLFLAWIAFDMDHPFAQLTMPGSPNWGVENIAAIWLMWALMMAAMMLPSALPMILTFTDLSLRSGEPARGRSFVAAYLVVWFAFSAAASALQWGLQAMGWVNPMIVSTSAWLTGLLLLIAGAYQFSPLKRVCLSRCRTPLGFLLGEWRGGTMGGFTMGLRHGLFCVGCCWALMALLFAGGVMNLYWIIGLTLYVMAEKLLPGDPWLSRLAGAGLLLGGLWLLAA